MENSEADHRTLFDNVSGYWDEVSYGLRRFVEVTIYRGWGSGEVTQRKVKADLHSLTQEIATLELD